MKQTPFLWAKPPSNPARLLSSNHREVSISFQGMKLLISLTSLTLILYFAANLILDRIFAHARSPEQTEIIFETGKAMAEMPSLQMKLRARIPASNPEKSGTSADMPAPSPSYSSIGSYFGNTDVDEQLKHFFSKRTANETEPVTELDQDFLDLSRYLDTRPTEAISALRNALDRIPQDDVGRTRVLNLYTQCTIHYLKDLTPEAQKQELQEILKKTPEPEANQMIRQFFPLDP